MSISTIKGFRINKSIELYDNVVNALIGQKDIAYSLQPNCPDDHIM